MRPRWASVTFALLAASCGSGGGQERAGTPPPPPPRIGSSITHTRLCECRQCDPAACCGGPRGSEPAPVERCGPPTGDPYDFSTNDCGEPIRIESCGSRCFLARWRVTLAEDCAARRPAECCPGG